MHDMATAAGVCTHSQVRWHEKGIRRHCPFKETKTKKVRFPSNLQLLQIKYNHR